MPDRPLLQEGMQSYINQAEKVPIIPLPTDISLHHKNIKLYFDFYMNIITFLYKKSYKITLLTAETFISKSVDTIIKKLHTVTKCKNQ